MSVKTVNISDALHGILKQAAEETHMSIPQLIQHCLFNQINRTPGFVSKELRKKMHQLLTSNFREKEFDFDTALEEIGFGKYYAASNGEAFYQNKQGIRLLNLGIPINPRAFEGTYSIEIDWFGQKNQELLNTLESLNVYIDRQTSQASD